MSDNIAENNFAKNRSTTDKAFAFHLFTLFVGIIDHENSFNGFALASYVLMGILELCL